MRTHPIKLRKKDPRGYGVSISTYVPEAVYADIIAAAKAEERTTAQILRMAWDIAGPTLLRRNGIKSTVKPTD